MMMTIPVEILSIMLFDTQSNNLSLPEVKEALLLDVTFMAKGDPKHYVVVISTVSQLWVRPFTGPIPKSFLSMKHLHV